MANVFPRLEVSAEDAEGTVDEIEEDHHDESKDENRSQQISDDWLLPFAGEEEEEPPVHAQRVTIAQAEDLSEITSQIGSLPCDYWWEKEGAWVRVHVQPRRAMFTPMESVGGPDPETLPRGRHQAGLGGWRA